MVYCRSCGKEIEEKDSNCPYCGAATRGQHLPGPVYPYQAQSSDGKVLRINVAVVVILIVIPATAAGILYLVVAWPHCGGPPMPITPTAAMSSELAGNDALNFTVLAVSTWVDLNDVWVNYRIEGSGGGFNVGLNLPAGATSAGESNGYEQVTFYDTNADHLLSTGDRIEVVAHGAHLTSGSYEIELRNVPTGDAMATITYVVP